MSASLRRFLITRLLLTIPMVLILISLVFFIMRVLPGDPIRSQLGPKVSAEQANVISERLGLNRPLFVQYFDFVRRTLTLNFGNALTSGERPIRDELGERLPATIELAVPGHVDHRRARRPHRRIRRQESQKAPRLHHSPFQYLYIFVTRVLYGALVPDHVCGALSYSAAGRPHGYFVADPVRAAHQFLHSGFGSHSELAGAALGSCPPGDALSHAGPVAEWGVCAPDTRQHDRDVAGRFHHRRVVHAASGNALWCIAMPCAIPSFPS